MSEEDWKLLEHWRDGDQDAGKTLLQRYFGMLMRFFHNKVADPEEVADLVSETMLACTAARDRIRQGSSFRSFLFATASNQLRRYYRSQRKRGSERDDFSQCCAADLLDARSLSSELGRKRETSLLIQGLRRLTLEDQIVLELSLFEELSGREIGELLEMPTATVHTRLRRGKAKLQVEIEQLASNPQEYRSTITDLEGWARMLREQIDRG